MSAPGPGTLDRPRRRARRGRRPDGPSLFAGPLLGPVARKEISGFSRRWQTYLGRGVYVALIGLVLYQFRSGLTRQGLYVSSSEYANLARVLFAAFVTAQLVFVTLISLSSASDLIAREVRTGTLPLLMLTPLSVQQIVAGKWKAAMAQSASLILCGLPVVAICVYLGGVGLWELSWSVCLTLSSAALGSAFALRYSATQPTANRAMLAGAAAYVLSAAFTLVLAGPFALLVSPFVHPVHAAVAAIHSRPDEFAGLGWVVATPVAFLYAIRTLRVAARKAEQHLTTPPALHMLRGDRLSLQIFTSRLPWLRTHNLSGGVWDDNPLLWKELATRPAARVSADLKQMTWIYFLLFMLLLFGITEGRHLGTFVFLGAVFVFVAAVAGASLFASDKEGRKFDILRSTPLTDRRIVLTKLVAVLLSPEGFVGIVLWLLWVAGWSWWAGPAGMLTYAAASGLYLLFSFALGSAASLRARTLRGALFFTIAVQTVLLVALPLGVSLLRDVAAAGDLRALEDMLSSVNPAAMLEDYGVRDRVSPGRFPPLARFAMLYVAATAALVGFTVRGFRAAMEAPRG